MASMKRFYGLVLVAAWSLLLPLQVAAAEKDIQALNDGWNKAFNDGDVYALAELYDENAVVSPGDARIVEGRDSIRELFKGFITGGLGEHRIQPIDTHANDDMIYQVAVWQARGEPDGGVKPLYEGILMTVFVRNDRDEWRIKSHVWNMAE